MNPINKTISHKAAGHILIWVLISGASILSAHGINVAGPVAFNTVLIWFFLGPKKTCAGWLIVVSFSVLEAISFSFLTAHSLRKGLDVMVLVPIFVLLVWNCLISLQA
jgi:K+ transporter